MKVVHLRVDEPAAAGNDSKITAFAACNTGFHVLANLWSADAKNIFVPRNNVALFLNTLLFLSKFISELENEGKYQLDE